MEPLRVDMSSRAEREALWGDLRVLEGEYFFEWHRTDKRTSPQNRLYFGYVVRPFRDFLQKQGQPKTLMECHQILAFKFLRTTEIDEATGEVLNERVRSTTELSVSEFSDYIENCREWLLGFGIVCPDQDEFYQKPAVAFG